LSLRVSLVAESFEPKWTTGRYPRELAKHLKGVDLDLVEVGESRRRGEFFLRSTLNRLRRPKGEIVHALDPSLFIDRKKSVVTFQDLMHRDSDRSMKVYERASHADRLIAISSQTADQLHSYFGVDSTVIPLGISDCFYHDPTIAKSPYSILYLGDLNPRKRIDWLIEGFAKLHRDIKDARLTLIGKPIASFNGPYEKKLMEMCDAYGLNGSVRFIGHLKDDLLNVYLNQAMALVVPSEEEGFGLPILEAQRCGCPVIIQKDARIPEEVSMNCIGAKDTDELAALLTEALKGPEGFDVDRMVAYSEAYTWEKTAELTKRVYESI
jgi:glycosyltransferase involved in cell wall biosynthesis